VLPEGGTKYTISFLPLQNSILLVVMKKESTSTSQEVEIGEEDGKGCRKRENNKA
jgi:hypothetical protein